ncbi:MAG TPA: ATP synthase F1 subunit delta [Planctomycetota bacterium]|nr:ATP synthase F1 subunit delta [Planctomycetota bacterium]
MATGTLVLGRYAAALLALASQAQAVERVRSDLGALSAAIAADGRLTAALASPRVTREQKRRLVQAALGGTAHDLVRRTALLLVDKGRAGLLAQFGGVFDEAAREAEGLAVARVVSAAPLDASVRQALVERLGALSGRTVSLEERVDAELLGGLRVVIGSQMIDGSVARRLDELRARLLQAPVA